MSKNLGFKDYFLTPFLGKCKIYICTLSYTHTHACTNTYPDIHTCINGRTHTHTSPSAHRRTQLGGKLFLNTKGQNSLCRNQGLKHAYLNISN